MELFLAYVSGAFTVLGSLIIAFMWVGRQEYLQDKRLREYTSEELPGEHVE